MRIDPNASRMTSQKLLSDDRPRRTLVGTPMNDNPTDTYIAWPGGGTGHDAGSILGNRVGRWVTRFNNWRSGFEEGPGPKARKYWRLYRAFDEGASPGPGQDWRDRTVIPQIFKLIETRVPKKIMGTWGKPEPFVVEGRGFRDAGYETLVRTVMQTHLDEIGQGQAQSELLLKRLIDAERYKEITGHVWWKSQWRKEVEWVKTKIPIQGEDGKVMDWETVEGQQTIFDGLDPMWLPLDSLAVDLGGIGSGRRWAIERIQTSLEALRYADEQHFEATGIHLYNNLDELEDSTGDPVGQQESYEEPRDTEHWPLTNEQVTGDPGSTIVEMWLCWDNIKRTLTKVGNRRVELDHGLAPTPQGLDPYLGVQAVPVPGRAYGESYIHWIGPLAQYQTRIARARADEILLNIWQQYIYREGTLRNLQWFWRPGGGMAMESSNPDRELSKDIMLLPRRPVFQEAYSEEAYRDKQSADTAGADATSQGVEPTTKSRDVTATEMNQRVLQGASRMQLENLYNEVSFIKPFLQMQFDLIQMNMTEEKMIRITDDMDETVDKSVDLRQLQRPIDIVVGGGLLEASQQEKLNELREIRDLGESQNYGPHIRHNSVAQELVKATRTLGKNSSRFVKTEEEVQREQQERQAAALAAELAKNGGAGGQPENGQSGSVTTGPVQGTQGGSPGQGGLNGASGSSPESSPSASGSDSFEI